jgi:outer membrane immunogenic protein
MKRLVLAACAGLAAAAMATPSIAADLGPRPVYKGPAFVAPVFTWTGFYIGANAGYGWGTSRWDPLVSFDTTGWLVGGTLGYNVQMGSVVFGVEGDIAWSNMKGDFFGVLETKVPWFGTARGRIGYAFDRFLPYITGGLAVGKVEMEVAGAGRDSETRYGWTVGAGVEWAFLANWSAKIEYLYADLGSASCDLAVCGGVVDVDFKTNIVRGGINYRF